MTYELPRGPRDSRRWYADADPMDQVDGALVDFVDENAGRSVLDLGCGLLGACPITEAERERSHDHRPGEGGTGRAAAKGQGSHKGHYRQVVRNFGPYRPSRGRSEGRFP